MKAIAYDKFGPAAEVLRLVERPDPQPGPGDVLVDVKASGVNPSDVKLRAGARPGGLAAVMPFPEIIPHSDGAGVISAVGEGVDPARVGRRVWLWNAQWERAHGSAAEKIALPSEQAAPLPDAAGFDVGACLGIPGVTAWCSVFSGGSVEGKDVLVAGGAGAVGALAIRMAKLGGARKVIATVSGPEKGAVAEAAGADAVVNYRSEDVVAAVRAATGGRGVDRISEVEFGGNLAASAELIEPAGWIVTYASMAAPTPQLPFYQLMFKNVTVKFLVVYRLEAALRRAAEADLHRWLSSGALTADIDARFDLADAAAAHDYVERGGRRGPVIVDV